LSCFCALTVYGFKTTLFRDKGEKRALAYIPDTAYGVVARGLCRPSIGQYLAFRKISHSLDRQGFSAKSRRRFEVALLRNIFRKRKNSNLNLRTSLAAGRSSKIGRQGTQSSEIAGYALIAVTNPSAVFPKIISRGTPAAVGGQHQGLRASEKQKSMRRFVADYLVVSFYIAKGG